ncbi:MAG: endonuclease/exonuclease/phosphatase family protein [bacterium]|nr:endonuclease/exonuclease/phosphatase family protein [bacterium]
MKRFNKQIRLMTYNIHSGIGRDRRYNLRRIIEIIRSENPDIITLQEVDRGLSRSNYDDQTRLLGEFLEMEAIHCGTRLLNGGDYGITVLSRFPFIRNHRYDISDYRTRSEPRYCLRVDVAVRSDAPLHIFNCHLGLATSERHYQRKRMLSEAILLNEDLHHPVVLMGDFNDRPVPVVHRILRHHFNDVFKLAGKRCGPTFKWGPLRWRLDHIYASGDVHVVDAWVLNDRLTRVASDHRPILAEVEVGWHPERPRPARLAERERLLAER